jgi:hypothetical protein
MSDFSKADSGRDPSHVRYGSSADIVLAASDVS